MAALGCRASGLGPLDTCPYCYPGEGCQKPKVLMHPCNGCLYHFSSALFPAQACHSCGLDYKNHTNPPQKPQDCIDMPSASSLAHDLQDAPQAAPGEPQGTIVNPKELAGAMKAPIWQVMPRWVILLVGRVMQVGAAKYGAFNYRSSNVWAMTYVDAIERHMQLWQDGEDNDPETGVSHLAHVIAGCSILLDAQANGKLGDDRSVTGQARSTLDLLDRLRGTHPLPAPQY